MFGYFISDQKQKPLKFEVRMDHLNVDLTIFEPKYRQALLFTMIEGLIEGESFSFFDNRTPEAIELELKNAELPTHTWERRATDRSSGVVYLVTKNGIEQPQQAGFCSCCC